MYWWILELQIVDGPEVLSKFVGETEKNVRDLFADAEQDQRTKGKEFSSLYQLSILSYDINIFVYSF